MLLVKVGIVAAGLIGATAVHYFYKDNPESVVIETVIENVVDETTGVEIKEMEDDIDGLVDALDGNNKKS